MRKPALEQGFTLIELLIVISLITVMTGAMIPRFSGYMDTQNLRQAQEQVKSDVRSTVVRALAGVGAANVNLQYWGIVFTAGQNRYDIISASDAIPTRIRTQTSEALPGDIVTKESRMILFDISDGNTWDGGSHTIIVGPSGATTTCAGVQVNSVGMVMKVSAACP